MYVHVGLILDFPEAIQKLFLTFFRVRYIDSVELG